MDISIDKLIEKSGTPVSLPDVFIKINQLTQDSKCSVADISRVAETDMSLSLRLLKIVNSPYYGFPSTIDSIPRAITIIGVQNLRDLTLATTTVDLFANNQTKQNHIRQLWRHSLFCAINSRLLAEALKLHHTERFFAAGLLHDIGRLILFQGIPETMHETIKQAARTGTALTTIEHALLGFTHTDIGCRIAHQWKLPESIIETIAYHHTPEKARQYPMETAIIHIANHMANTLDVESSIEVEDHGIDHYAWKISGLNMETVYEVLSKAPEQFAELQTVLMPKTRAA